MKKLIGVVIALLVLVGCGTKNYDITFDGNGREFSDGKKTLVLNTSNKEWKNEVPKFKGDLESFFLGWESNNKDVDITKFDIKEYNDNVTLSAKWDEEGIAKKAAEDKEIADKKAEEARMAAEKKAEEARIAAEKRVEEAKIAAEKKEEENELQADLVIVMAKTILNKNFAGQATFEVKKEVVDDIKVIGIYMNITSKDIIDAFAYNISKGMFKDEMSFMLSNLNDMEKQIVKANKSDYRILYIINNPANNGSMLYYSLDGVVVESLFKQ